MCSDCEEAEPICSFCGTDCYGHCDDLDTCPCCWGYKNDPMGMFIDDDFDDDIQDECAGEQCQCECHEEFNKDMGLRFEHGVWKDDNDDGPPFVRKGVFPFLKLAGEIREKIYGFAFLQDGNKRSTPTTPANHRGNIHTALLRTCRQVYKEAGHLPLSINTLNFSTGLYALDYLGFTLLPSQKDIVTSIHIEFYYQEFSTITWQFLLRQLAKMPITHLGLTIKGGYAKDAFLGHQCFASRFAAVMKGIKSFDVILGSSLITKKAKEEIQEEMRETLIDGYKRPKPVKSKAKAKRNAASETGDKGPTKKAKKAIPKIKHQTKLVISPKSARLGTRSSKPERDAAEAAKEKQKQALLAQYGQLREYATSIDHDVTPVRIRLEDARKAAETADEPKFRELGRSIYATLEERYDKISVARANLHSFVKSSRVADLNEPTSSQESSSSLSTPSSSQLSD